MNTTPIVPDPNDEPETIGDRNLEHLLGKAYHPEVPDADFMARVQAAMQAEAELRAQHGDRRLIPVRRLAAWAAAAAAVLVGAGLVLNDARPFRPGNSSPGNEGSEHAQAGSSSRTKPAWPDSGLTPRPRPPAPPAAIVKTGETITTHAGERRRFALADRSVLFLNQSTSVKVEAERRVTLTTGEAFIEVAPRTHDAGGGQSTFIVQTPGRTVSALGTKFAVRVEPAGTGVVVTQGKVQVSGLDSLLTAGQQLLPNGLEVAAAPRLSTVLDWTRELMAAADTPLVPANRHGGGALVAVDPFGQEAKLSLRKYHIDVHIEDGFARTTIDRTYFNRDWRQLEGTFYFPLPPDASLSRLAMYVDGKRMEGGMADRDAARDIFETIRYANRDPALLEWVDGSTFKMRVFPLEARQEKRIILSYVQRLPALYGRMAYRFPAGHSLDMVRDWSFRALLKDGASWQWNSTSHGLNAIRDGNDLVLTAEAKQVKLDRDVVLEISEPANGGSKPPRALPAPGNAPTNQRAIPLRSTEPALAGNRLAGPLRSTEPALAKNRGANTAESPGQLRFASTIHDGRRYFSVRFRPQLAAMPKRQRRDWIFLFESSGDRDPLLARTQVEIVRTLLANAEHDDTFSILTAGTHVALLSEKPQLATRENSGAALAELERTHLIGALDLDQALRAAERLVQSAANPYVVHLGTGLPVLGETRQHELAERLPTNARYIGIGVGKRWNRNFMKAAAERNRGYFTQINPDEPVTWRAFDLLATLNTPRLLHVEVADDARKVVFLSDATILAQGEEFFAVARSDAAAPLPLSITVSGMLEGQPYRRSFAVGDVAEHADYLPRTWAKLEIDRLLAENAEINRAQIVALSKDMYVMSPFTSLLVLENEEMYARFKVDRGRKDHWAMYPCPERIPVVKEPDADLVAENRPQGATTKSVEDVLDTIVVRVPPTLLTWETKSRQGPTYTTMLYEYWSDDEQVIAVPFPGIDLTPKRDVIRYYDPVYALVVRAPAGLNSRIGSSRKKATPASGSSPFRSYDGRPFETIGRYLSETPFPVVDGIPWTSPPNPNLHTMRIIDDSSGPRMHRFSNQYQWARGMNVHSESGWAPVEGKAVTDLTPRGGITRAWDIPLDGGWFNQTNRFGEWRELTQKWKKRWGDPSYSGRGGDRLKEVVDIENLLREPTDKLKAGIAKGTPLKDALDFLCRIHNVRPGVSLKYKINQRAFADAGEPNIDETLVDLPPTRNVSLATVLSELLARIQPPAARGAFVIKGDYIEITTVTRAWNERLLEELNFARWDDGPRAESWQGSLYQRPHFTGDWRVFSDLLSYAPGMNTLAADIAAVVAAEAPNSQPAAGKIDPAARALIERARQRGWQAVTQPAPNGVPTFTVRCNGNGQYTFERAVTEALRELVVCDGATLWHLYPEIGVGAKRTMSRFHRQELTKLVPGHVPPADDLAHEADVRLVAERTVAIVPRGSSTTSHDEWRLVFGAEDRLTERVHVAMPENKTLYRETYAADGTVRSFDGDGKMIAEHKFTVRRSDQPKLRPDTRELVVLPLPYRTREQVANGRVAEVEKGLPGWSDDDALALLAADVAQANREVFAIAKHRFFDNGDRRLGFYTLLLAATQTPMKTGTSSYDSDWTGLNVIQEYPEAPLAKYIVQQLAARQGKPPKLQNLGGEPRSFLQRLANFLGAYARFQGLGISFDESLGYVRTCDSSPFGWAILGLLLDNQTYAAQFPRELAEAAENFGRTPFLSYAARYEQARNLLNAGNLIQAQKRFRDLYLQTLEQGVVPPLDKDFRRAFNGSWLGTPQPAEEQWLALLREAASTLIAKGSRSAVVALAWQCRTLDEKPLADELLAAALANPPDADRLATTLAAVRYLTDADELARAAGVLQGLLAGEPYNQSAALWRLAATLADKRGMQGQAVKCLDRASDIDFETLPEVVDLQALRYEYGDFLARCGKLADTLSGLQAEPPRELIAIIVRAADRWRMLDPEPKEPCHAAARALLRLGARDLAWDYLTTPLATKPNEAAPWLDLARLLREQGDTTLADRAYALAFAAEPTNAQILWDRAQLLGQSSRADEARKLYREIADGQWQPRFRGIQEQARRLLEKPVAR